jgi:hypothetical protein
MNFSSFILTSFLVATANATRKPPTKAAIRGSTGISDVNTSRSASLVICPSQDALFAMVDIPPPDGSYEDGLQCDYEYRFFFGSSENDLKCSPLTMCSYENNLWQCMMSGIFCDPEMEYETGQAQCGDVCGPDNNVCPTKDALFAMNDSNNNPPTPGLYEDGLQCDFEYVYTGTSANDLQCTPLTMCTYNNQFDDDEDSPWLCMMGSIWCDPEIVYEDNQAQCGDTCEIRSCPRPGGTIDDTIINCPSDIQEWPELVGLCGDSAKAWLEQQYIDTGACPNLDVQIITANSVVTYDIKLDRVRILIDENIYGNDIVIDVPYVG